MPLRARKGTSLQADESQAAPPAFTRPPVGTEPSQGTSSIWTTTACDLHCPNTQQQAFAPITMMTQNTPSLLSTPGGGGAWLKPQQSWEGPLQIPPWEPSSLVNTLVPPECQWPNPSDTKIDGDRRLDDRDRDGNARALPKQKPWPCRTIYRKDTCHQESLLAKRNLNWIKPEGLNASFRKYRAQRKQPVRSRRGMP